MKLNFSNKTANIKGKRCEFTSKCKGDNHSFCEIIAVVLNFAVLEL